MLVRLLTVLLFVLGISGVATAQGIKLSGKILNDKNEPQAGVSVKVTNGPGTTSDGDGNYSLQLAPSKKYEINFSAVGYAPKLLNKVEVVEGQENSLNVVMEVVSRDLTGVTVTATATSARRENVASIIQFQKNTNTVASVISAESIRRSPDRNTGEVLKRTPGTSIQEGKFIIVRGLADRYNQAMLNGVLLTSTEPDRKTFSFDLIPSAMIDNIVINKAFVPELPGEWAGGLIQVNTKDIPSVGFFNVQVGTGFNTQTIGNQFYRNKGGKLDFLGMDDGYRALPSGYKNKSTFGDLSFAERTAIGKQLKNSWVGEEVTAPLNFSFQANGGFNQKLFGKTVGGTFGLLYNKSNRFIKQLNQDQEIQESGLVTPNFSFNDNRYVEDVSIGALGSLTVQFSPRNRVSLKSIVNVNSPNSVTNRSGIDYTRADIDDVNGSDFTFKENTFFTNQLSGDHTLASDLRFKWYGSFTILDGYIPDQRRILYTRTTGTQNPFKLLIANSLSQQTGSRIFQNLSDYIYTGGGDVAYNFNLFDKKQTVKGGYMLQIKDRLYDGKFFANYLSTDNEALRLLPADQVFAPQNFGNGTDNQFGFDAIKNKNFRYMANTILNAGFLQLDNQLLSALRVVWGVRVEHYDQLVGSVKTSDTRHFNTKVLDVLPGVNATYKINNKTNLRLSGSQTVIRPELRELSFLNIYDFELNASVQGSPVLKRTKVTNLDLRYELYPAAGEIITAGVFYKNFKDPIEQLYERGTGGSSTFFYRNPEKATAYGAELELRKKLGFINGLQNFTFQANTSFIYSLVEDSTLEVDRPLQGQSPYVLNLGLLYDLPKAGFTATLLYNQIGKRIYVVGNNNIATSGAPDVYEASRPLIDLQLTKKILKTKGEIKINISDIINQTQYFYQNTTSDKSLEKDKDPYRFTRKFGTTFGFTFGYTL